MTKYVCDFEQLETTINKLDTNADEIANNITDIKNYASNTLIWEGVARETFDVSLTDKCNQLTGNVNEIKNISAFLTISKQTIESAETSLAQMKI